MNAMNPSHHTPDPLSLEGRLAAMTRGPDEPAALWRRALEEASRPDAAPATARPAQPFWQRELSGAALAWLGVAAVICLMVGVMIPSLGTARQAARRVPPSASEADRLASRPAAATERQLSVEGGWPAGSSAGTDAVFERITAMPDGRGSGGRTRVASPAAQPEGTSVPADRHVIRKVTLELTVADVHAAFLKAQLLISDATGEYVEASSLRGEGAEAHGTLTLRVAASRLSEVLNLLRPLGAVASEQQTGEDVTAAVVDLEARLRNERQVEEELLELLDTRAEAPLNDVLTLRSRIAEVRGEIERLEGQRERFARLTSLATVLVILRAEAADEAEKPGDSDLQIGALFEDAWESGVRATIQTLAAIVRILVGGALWWVLLVVVLVVVRGRMRRQALLEGRIG